MMLFGRRLDQKIHPRNSAALPLRPPQRRAPRFFGRRAGFAAASSTPRSQIPDVGPVFPFAGSASIRHRARPREARPSPFSSAFGPSRIAFFCCCAAAAPLAISLVPERDESFASELPCTCQTVPWDWRRRGPTSSMAFSGCEARVVPIKCPASPTRLFAAVEPTFERRLRPVAGERAPAMHARSPRRLGFASCGGPAPAFCE